MSNIASTLGVQSFCFRHFDENAKVAELVKTCGLDAIEICRKHVNFDDPSTHAPAIKAYQDAGVRIVSIGVQGIHGDEAAQRPQYDFLKACGATFMSISFGMDGLDETLKTAEALAEEYDVHLAIHNHGGRHVLGNAEMLKYIFSRTGKRIGLCIDTAWAQHSHEDPVGWVRTFGERVYGVHIKDFIFDLSGKHQDVVVGTGNLDLAALEAALTEVGFEGYAVLEYEGDVENPVPALQHCVANVKGRMQ